MSTADMSEELKGNYGPNTSRLCLYTSHRYTNTSSGSQTKGYKARPLEDGRVD